MKLWAQRTAHFEVMMLGKKTFSSSIPHRGCFAVRFLSDDRSCDCSLHMRSVTEAPSRANHPTNLTRGGGGGGLPLLLGTHGLSSAAALQHMLWARAGQTKERKERTEASCTCDAQ